MVKLNEYVEKIYADQSLVFKLSCAETALYLQQIIIQNTVVVTNEEAEFHNR